MNWGGHKGK